MNIDIDGLIEKAKAAYADGLYDPRVGLTALEKEFCLLASPHTILALCERLREAESAMKLSLKLLQDGEVDSAIDQIEEALNPEVSDE